MTALRLDEVQHDIAAAESEEAIQFLKDRGIRHRGRPQGMILCPAARIFLAGKNEFYLAEDMSQCTTDFK